MMAHSLLLRWTKHVCTWYTLHTCWRIDSTSLLQLLFCYFILAPIIILFSHSSPLSCVPVRLQSAKLLNEFHFMYVRIITVFFEIPDFRKNYNS